MAKLLKGKETGSTLIMILFTMTILSLLILSVSILAMGENRMSDAQKNYVKSTYIAEGGIEKTLTNLKTDSNWKPNGIIEIGEGYCEVDINEVIDEDEEYPVESYIGIESIGYYDNAFRIIRVGIKKPSKKYHHIFDYSISSNEILEIHNNFSSNGNVLSNGIITGNNHNNGEVKGDVYASGIEEDFEINFANNDEYQFYEIESIKFPLDDDEFLEEFIEENKDKAFDGPNYYLKDVHWTSNKEVYVEGYAYIDGDLTITGNIDLYGKGLVIVEGDVKITGNLTMDREKPVSIISTGDFYLGNNDFFGAIYSLGEFNGNNNANIYGSVVANTISKAGFAAEHDKGILEDLELHLPNPQEIELLFWNEI